MSNLIENPSLRPKPLTLLRPDYLFCDIEASSLWTPKDHDDQIFTHPVEIGFANDALDSSSFLIRPHATWTRIAWDPVSQNIHGISRERLFDEGVPVEEAVERVDAACLSKRGVFSDCVDWDGYWLRVLYAAVGRKMPFRLYDDLQAVGDHLGVTEATVADVQPRIARAMILSEEWPHPHRAAEDAVRMAAGFRIAVDSDFEREVLAMSPRIGDDD